MKHSLKTRALAALLAVVMVLGMVPVTSYAAEETEVLETQEVTVPVETAEETEALEVAEAEETEAEEESK